MNETMEKLLIQTYKQMNEVQNQIEQIINHLGQQQQHLKPPKLPEDIQHLVQMALDLSPEQRKTLRLFLESIQKE